MENRLSSIAFLERPPLSHGESHLGQTVSSRSSSLHPVRTAEFVEGDRPTNSALQRLKSQNPALHFSPMG
jgi:hypothetical protein